MQARPSNVATRTVVQASAVKVTDDGRVIVAVADGRTLECRVPMHVDLGWLRAALARGPVTSEITVGHDDEESSLWSLFPGPEHEGVVPDTVEIAAGEGIHLVCGNSRITMVGKELRVRSRDVTVSGSRATRVRGGTVKLN